MAKTRKTAKKPPTIENRVKKLAPNWHDASPMLKEEKPRKKGRKITIEDIYAWDLPGNPQVSPDGTKVVYEVLSIDKKEDDYRSTLWLIEGDAAPRKLTSGAVKDSWPAWSPDGTRIAFTSDRDEKNQLFVLPIAGGEAQQITKLESGVGQFVWSPDSSKIAFTSRIAPKKDDDEENDKSDVKIITSAYYKFDGMGFIDDKASHIFIVDADGGEAEQLTGGAFNHTQIAFSPNGYEIAFISNKNPDWDISRVKDVWSIDIHSKKLKQLTDGKGSWGSPLYSPDGKSLALIGHEDAYAEDVNFGLFVLPATGGKTKRLGKNLDRTVADTGMSGPSGTGGRTLLWDEDGTFVDAVVSDRGDTFVVRFPRDGKKPTALTPAGLHIKSFGHRGDDLVIAAATPSRSVELYQVTGKGVNRLTQHNDAWVEEVRIPQPEEIWFESGDEVIQGWLIRPKGNTAKSKKKAPLVLNIHGGPHAQFTPAFFHELQMYVSRGYALVFINPRGSTGRSNDFGKAVKAKWGFADMPDFMAAVDHVLALGGLDGDRVGVTGGSYGGFSTNWLLGHTDRFKAAVTDRSISNMMSMFGTDDISLPYHDLALGAPWENPKENWEASPLAYVKNVTAPCLIIHSEEDYRCPMEQAEQWYMALKFLGRTVEFVRFPNESHSLGRSGKPKHRVERLKRTLDWFDRYL